LGVATRILLTEYEGNPAYGPRRGGCWEKNCKGGEGSKQQKKKPEITKRK